MFLRMNAIQLGSLKICFDMVRGMKEGVQINFIYKVY